MRLSNDNISVSSTHGAFTPEGPDKDTKSTSVWSSFKSIILSPRTSAKTLIGICGAAIGNTALAAGVALRILKKPEAHLQSINALLKGLTTSFNKESLTESKDSTLDNAFLEKTKKTIDTCISELTTCEKKLPNGEQKDKIQTALASLESAKGKLASLNPNILSLHACFKELRPAKETVQGQLNLPSSKDDDEVVSDKLLKTSQLDYRNSTDNELEIFRDSVVAVNPTNTSPPQEAKEKVQNILFSACRTGDVTKFGILLNNLLRSGDLSNLQAKNAQGDTLLHVAAQTGNVHITSMLISAGAELDAKNKIKNTPLETVSHQLTKIEWALNPGNHSMNSSIPDKSTITAYRNQFEENKKQNPLYQNLLKIHELLSPPDPLNNQQRPNNSTDKDWLSTADENY